MSKKLTKNQTTGFAVLGCAIMIVLWSIMSVLLGETRFPSPWKVIARFFTTITACPQIKFEGAGEHGFYPHILVTLARYIVGVGLGTILSFIFLFLIARFKTFKEFFNPLVEILRAIPPLALAPFFLLWFGVSQWSIIAIITFYAFTMIFVAGAEALERQNPVQANFARTLGAGKNVVAANVMMPALLPELAGPIKVAYSWSWGLVIVGELLGAQSGIGRIINAFISILKTDLIVVGIIWVVIMAIVIEKIVDLVLGKLLEWNAGENK